MQTSIMIDEEIDKMGAGSEIDLLVGTIIMGWKIYTPKEPCDHVKGSYLPHFFRWQNNDLLLHRPINNDIRGWTFCKWWPSFYISDVWEVQEKIFSIPDRDLHYNYIHALFELAEGNPIENMKIVASASPLLRCRAALKAANRRSDKADDGDNT